MREVKEAKLNNKQTKMDKEMSEAFFDWLNECPVQWLRLSDDEESTSYQFTKPNEEDN